MKSRWITVVRFRHHRRKYVIINYHGNAVVQARESGALLRRTRRAAQWIRASIRIQFEILRHKAMGYRVLVTGDFNYRRRNHEDFKLDFWSPQRVFRRNGLSWVEHGLDYVAYPKKMVRRRVRVIPTSETGADHAWIIVDIV